jgi:hypothetical protein
MSPIYACILAILALINVARPTVRVSRSQPHRTQLDWAALRRCESGGRYDADTGNGFYGAYQFNLGTWRSVGGSGNPAQASPAEQDQRARTLYEQRGRRPWPVCGRYL